MEVEIQRAETTFINAWADEGCFELVVNTTIVEAMRRLGIDLVDINYVLKTGTVVRSDMRENHGLWDVHGETVDERNLEVRVAVVSSEYEVELLRITQLRRS